MPVEIVNGIQDLNPSWPTATDPVSEGDDHSRAIKSAIQQSFPNMTGAWVTTSQIKANGFDATDSAIVNVGTPINLTDAARKGDVDAVQAQVYSNDTDIAALQANDTVQDLRLDDAEERLDDIEAQVSRFISYGSWSDGATTNPPILGGSGDWSVVRQGVGQYEITFTEAASAQYGQSLQVMPIGVPPFSLARAIDVAPISTTVWGVYCYNASDGPNHGDPIDANLMFFRVAD